MKIRKEIKKKSYLKIYSCEASREIAEKIAKTAGRELGECELIRFKDGEFQPFYKTSIRGAHVFIIQSTVSPGDNLLELLLMIDAAKRASAYKVIAVIPYYGFARQDKKDAPRVSIGAKLIANLLHAAGIDRLITMDFHSDTIQGFFDIPVDHLYSSAVLVPYIQSLNIKGLLIASPDIGGAKRAKAYSRFLSAELAICHKTRLKPNVVEDITLIGNVKDKNVLIVDDIIDTGGTIVNAAKLIKENGAKSIRVFATHPLFSGDAYEKIENSEIDTVLVTDTIPLEKNSKKVKVLSVADIFSTIITYIYKYKSISHKFLE